VAGGNMSIGTASNIDIGASANAAFKSVNGLIVESTGDDITIKSSSSGKIDLNPA
jgi:uncharacterized protein YbaP (TraB family)